MIVVSIADDRPTIVGSARRAGDGGAAFAASIEAHDIKLHAHEDKVREEENTRARARALSRSRLFGK